MTKHLHELVAEALAGDPAEAAMEYEGALVPWRYLRDVADRLDRLLTGAGLGATSPIGFVPRNRPAFAAALLSLIAARRSIVMVYAFQSPQAIASDLARLALPAVIADDQDWTAETLGALGAGALAISLSRDPAAAAPVRLVAGPDAGDRLPADRAAFRPATGEPVVELLTSGTTGAPKRSPTRYEVIERAVIAGSVLDAGGEGKKGEPGTVNFPISNISGLYSYLPMAVARRLVLFLEKFDLDRWLAFVARTRPRVVVLPPAGVRMMLDRRIPKEALAGVRFVSVGTAATDPVTHKAFEDAYGVPILLSYGATEFCGAATTMTADLHARYGKEKFGSVGRASGSNVVRIVDPQTGAPLPGGAVGLIEVKVPFLGDDFIRTTDLGLLDEDDFLFHRGRVDGVIVRGGFKVMPGSVETALNAFPGVAASSVVGVSEPRLGQVPVAVIEMRAGEAAPDRAALDAHLRASLPATNIPTAYEVVDALPRTPSLKVDLKVVRAFAEEKYGRRAEATA